MEVKEEVLSEEPKQRYKTLRSRAFQFASGITAVLLSPISDMPSQEDRDEAGEKQADEVPMETADEPDTSSFAAFLYSLLAPSDSTRTSGVKEVPGSRHEELVSSSSEPRLIKENVGKRSVLSKGKQALSKVLYQAAKIGGLRHQASKIRSDPSLSNASANENIEQEGVAMQTLNKYETLPLENLPETSEPSLLLSDKFRLFLYSSLPVIVQGRKWILLYSTWRHGISLSTLYRRSVLWPGLSLLVVGDCEGSVFGGLVEAPLRPAKMYQGTNNSFVFSNTSGQPLIFRPTGKNRYFTLCSADYLALGGGSHFALYLDSDLLAGSSDFSETYGNPCLANSQDFQVKEVELWGFVYASKYDEMVAASSFEEATGGVCRW